MTGLCWTKPGVGSRVGTMTHTLVIGYGNPLRGDDQIGWLVAEQLRDAFADDVSGDIEIISCHQLTPEHADILSRAEKAIFIDACEGPHPGTIIQQIIVPGPVHTTSFTHNLGPATLLNMAQILYGQAPRTACMLTIAAESFDYTEALSPLVAAALPSIVERVLGMLPGAACSTNTG